MTDDADELPEICRLTDFSGDILGAACPQCGHSNVVHYHAPECVVCALQYEVAILRKARS
jgi:ribosomal protein S27E